MRTFKIPIALRIVPVLFALALGASHSVSAQERIVDQWPLEFTSGTDQVQVFAPQPEGIDGEQFTARFAVSLKRPTDENPLFGAVWGNGVLEVDRDSRMGRLTSFTVTDVRFPGIDDAAEKQRIKEMLGEGIKAHAAPIAVDWLVAALENDRNGTDPYANEPPEIIYREKPGVLVFIDGDPQYTPIEGSVDKNADPNYPKNDLKADRVVNTPFLMLRLASGVHYLYGSGTWFTAPAVVGPWSRSFAVPQELRELVQRVDPTEKIDAQAADGSTVVPEIVVRTTPAVLLDLDGPPKFRALTGTALLYAANTEDDLFLDVASQDQYLLASGRWFATRDPKTGPWRYVPADQLPADFALIPEGSAKDGALAHVAGTHAAEEAVRDASIPQTAKIDRRTASLNVQYDGDPTFEQIPGTAVENAINSSVTVLRIKGRYHALDNAVWFEGPTPDGPWTVSTAVPDEVNSIPPSSPVYNTRYVYIYNSTPDLVYVGYTPGYLGCYVQSGAVIWGTGYYYRPWHGRWRPRPFTWGFGVQYNPWAGWGYGLGWGWNWYYPSWYGWGWGGGYRPWGCGFGWWGPYGYHPAVVNHHQSYYGHRSGEASLTSASTGRSAAGVRAPAPNLYDGREQRGVQPTRVARTAATVDARGEQRSPAPTNVRTERPTSKPATVDHFTDREGNVYRQSNGRTERYATGKWETMPVERPTAAPVRANERPVQRTEQTDKPDRTPVTPRVERNDPRSIQQSRERGQQRVNDFDRSNQRQVTKPQGTPSRDRAPARTTPSRQASPSRSTAPSRQAAPSRSTSPSRGTSPSTPKTPRR